MKCLNLRVLPGTFAVCRLAANETLPTWIPADGFISVTRTDEELSIVCAQEQVPEDAEAERAWACLKVLGPLDFSLTGILANLATALADAGISIFAISTYNTDYLLVKQADVDTATAALTAAGHEVLLREISP